MATPTPDEQREIIARDMMMRRWRAGASHERYAKEWGISERTVSQRALEASRAIQLSIGDTGGFIAAKMAELDTIIRDALEKTKHFTLQVSKDNWEVHSTPDPDLKAAIAAIRVQAEIVGVIGRAKQQPRDEDVKSKYREWTPSQRIEKLEQALAEERAKMAQERH